MNKYEKSYNSIMKLLSVEQLASIVISHSIYKELVERATPKKLNGDVGDWACPNCDSDYYVCSHDDYNDKYTHCASCGQALDWNE